MGERFANVGRRLVIRPWVAHAAVDAEVRRVFAIVLRPAYGTGAVAAVIRICG